MGQRYFRTCAAVFIAAACAACTAPSGGPRVAPAQTIDARPPEQQPSPSHTEAAQLGSAPQDLRDVDWTRVTIPGQFCDIPGVVKLSEEEGGATSNTWGKVHVGRLPEVVYGNVAGNASDEAAITVECDNGGGTAAGNLAFAVIVMSGREGRLTALGTLSTQYNPTGVEHPTLIAASALVPGKVTVEESWFRPSDANCCPSGKAETIWTLQADGSLSPGPVRITS